MCYFRLLILAVLGFLTWTDTWAQQSLNYLFRHIDQADGLLHNDILSVTQDGKGFIWIATPNGLQRYDGSRFIKYPEMLNNADEGLTSTAEMYADKNKGLIWIMNNNNVEKLELGTNHFTLYNGETLLKDASFDFAAYRGVRNERWILGRHALYRYDSIKNKYIIICLNFLPDNASRASFIATDSTSNTTWALTSGSQLYMFDKKSKTAYSNSFNPLRHPLLQPALYGTRKHLFRFVMIDSKRDIWITTWNDMLYRYNDATKKVSAYSLASINKPEGKKESSAIPLINCMLEDDNHTLWLGTENAGLLRYNREQDNFDYCISREKNSESIRYNYKIFNLFQDKERNIWVGTDRGISIFNPYRQYFKALRHEANNASIGKNEIISFIQASTGELFIGTWGGGIAVYDQQLNFKKMLLFKGPPEKNFVWSFLQADDKTLWIGCQHGWLLVHDLVTGSTQTLHPPEMEGSTIRCMEKDNKGNIILGLHNGKIVQWNQQQGRFTPYGAGAADSLKRSAAVLNMLIDSSQHCWVSTMAGFKEFDLEKRVYTHTWLPDRKNASSISGKTCQGIEEYNDSILLVGTAYGGVNFFNKKTKTFSHPGIADGLPSTTVYAIKKGRAGNIWFTTDYGLYKFSSSEKKIVPYSIDPGIITSTFAAYRFYPLRDGQWLTFTTSEAISFFPGKVAYRDNQQPKIEITGFKIFDKPVFMDSLLFENRPIRLSYKENFFTVEFAALNFLELHQTNYQYRLRGIDKNWVNGGAKRFANYTDLRPGEYIFDVRAESDRASGATTSIKIIIIPPFWKTGWFMAAVCCCILLFIFLFVKWREKNIKAIEAEKLKVQQLNAAQYKSKLELEQIINYFSSSLIDKNTVEDVLWDVAKNLIGRIGFVDCMMYLWNEDKTRMIQKAGFGPKGSVEKIKKQYFDVLPGQGVVGYVMQMKEPVLIPDTSKDSRYRPDEMVRLSEITVPVIYNDELIGVIDSEHHEKNFFTRQHLQILSTIATLVANKIKSIEAEQSLRRTQIEMYSMNELLSKAKLEALRSQMNPHFIFNCINSIDALIHSNDKYNATVYLNKFAKLLRNILDSSNQNTVRFSKDIEALKLYIELEELRHENKFKPNFEVDAELLNSDYKVPPLIIQPYVENAILHGLKNKDGNDGILTVSIKRVDDKIQYVIVDNGIGRKAAGAIIHNKETHYGMQMSYDRIKLFNKETIASVQIDDLCDNVIPRGTRVTVNLNII